MHDCGNDITVTDPSTLGILLHPCFDTITHGCVVLQQFYLHACMRVV